MPFRTDVFHGDEVVTPAAKTFHARTKKTGFTTDTEITEVFSVPSVSVVKPLFVNPVRMHERRVRPFVVALIGV